MAKFKYTGPEMMVGRFGKLKTGAVVELWQSEAEYVLAYDSTNWKDVSKEDTQGVGSIIPVKVAAYDLSRIDWLRECRSSLKRMSRGELGDVALAMRELGCPIPSEPEARTFSREHLFEVLYGEARRLKWDQYTADPNAASAPTVQGQEQEQDSPEDVEETTVRAHNEDGTFKSDDPETSENEAFVGKVKRVVRKKN